MKKLGLILLMVGLALAAVYGQRGYRDSSGWRGYSEYESYHSPRQIPQHGYETPSWTNTPGFDADTFTFARIHRDIAPYSNHAGWWVDTPDSDLNLSFRLQQMTSMKVNPDGIFLRLTDKELYNYPFIYMVEPGSLSLREEEVPILRKYLLNGGFLMFDDFWGDREWAIMEREMKKVFPDRSFEELSLDHPIYRCVFQIKAKGQVPNVATGTQAQYTGITWERPYATDTRVVHHRVILDDKGRIMVIALHNTDNGDGWEWEGDNHYYFAEFSEKIAYPLAINIIFYTMTH